MTENFAGKELVGSDRRHEERYRKGTEVGLSQRGQARFVGQLQNLSVGGFCVESRISMEPGQRLHFEMELPGRKYIAGDAEVRWVVSYQVSRQFVAGAKISSLGITNTSHLHRYLEPHSFDWVWSLDLLIKGMCAIIMILVVRELVNTDDALTRMLAAPVGNFLEYLPALMVSAAAVVGILMFFRSD